MIYEKTERKLVIPFSKTEWVTVSKLNNEDGIAVMIVRNNNGNFQSKLLGAFKHKNKLQVALTFLSILYPVHAVVENSNPCSLSEIVEGENTIKFDVSKNTFKGAFAASFSDTPKPELTIYLQDEATSSIYPITKYIFNYDNGIKSVVQNPLGSVYCDQPCREIDLLNDKF